MRITDLIIIIGIISLISYSVWYIMEFGMPFTKVARAKMHRRRLVNARKAELITRGYNDNVAGQMADYEILEEARRTTKLLESSGLE